MLRHAAHRIQVPAQSSLRAFGLLACLFGAAQGAFTAIFPLVLRQSLGSDASVGYYYAAIGLIALLVSICSTVVFRKFSRVTVMQYSFAVAILATAFMTLAKNIWHLAGLDVPRAIAVLLTNIAFALIVGEHLKKALASGQAKVFAWANVGWLLGPVIGGLTAAHWGYEAAFISSSVLFVVCLVYFLYQHFVVRHPHFSHARHEESIAELFGNVRGYLRRPELARILRMSFGINFWWVLRGIYIPLAIIGFGFGPSTVGLMGALTGLPLVALEAAVGKGAQARGVRWYMIIGFAALAVFAASFGLSSRYFPALFALFVIANTAAALIDPLQNVYFFEAVAPAERERFFGIYNTGVLLAPIIAPLLGGLVIGASGAGGTNLSGVWFLLAGAMLVFFLDALRIRKKY